MKERTRTTSLWLIATALSCAVYVAASAREASAVYTCTDMQNDHNCRNPAQSDKDHCEGGISYQGTCWGNCSEGGVLTCSMPPPNPPT